MDKVNKPYQCTAPISIIALINHLWFLTMDKLCKTRYFNHITKNEHPYGINATVAIMCYSGYNVEDAIIVNRGALKRGLFNTTYYNIYESEEEKQESALKI